MGGKFIQMIQAICWSSLFIVQRGEGFLQRFYHKSML